MQRCNKSIRQNFSCISIIEDCNLLPEEIMSSKSVIQFKTKLDKCWRGKIFDIIEIYYKEELTVSAIIQLNY